MPSIAIKHAIIAALFASCTTVVSAAPSVANKPPRYINEPLLGLRLAVSARLDPVSDAMRVMCKRVPEDDTSIARFWIFAQTSDGGTVYYVTSGYSEIRKEPTAAPLYEAVHRGVLYIVSDGQCRSDPADEYFEGPSDEVPLPILKALARDLVTRLVRAIGGADKLRAEVKNQRIDFDALSPELQEAFRPYFGK